MEVRKDRRNVGEAASGRNAPAETRWVRVMDGAMHFKDGESWDKFLHQGIRLLEQSARDNRIRVPDPKRNLQLKVERNISPADSFIAFVDAIGEMDGTPCLIDWKNHVLPV